MDRAQDKDLYTVSVAEVARKNFVAGFSRALGGFVVTLISWAVLYVIIVKLILPQITTELNQLQNIMQLFPKTSTGTTQGTTLQVPDSVMKQIEQLQNTKQ